MNKLMPAQQSILVNGLKGRFIHLIKNKDDWFLISQLLQNRVEDHAIVFAECKEKLVEFIQTPADWYFLSTDIWQPSSIYCFSNMTHACINIYPNAPQEYQDLIKSKLREF